jgi:hypothetical protein
VHKSRRSLVHILSLIFQKDELNASSKTEVVRMSCAINFKLNSQAQAVQTAYYLRRISVGLSDIDESNTGSMAKREVV